MAIPLAEVDRSLAELAVSVRAQFEEADAHILEVRKAAADAQGAVSSLETSVNASIGDLTAGINQKFDSYVKSDGTAAAYYTLNLGVDKNGVKYNCGMAFGIEPKTGGGYKSSVIFAADTFGIYTGSTPGNYELVFAVSNGQAILKEAFIGNGTITNAKIGNEIYSLNYVKGISGWYIGKNGEAEFNNATFRGTIYATNGQFSGVVEAKSFIGDVANGYVFADTAMTSGAGAVTRSFRYTDSATTALDKQILVMCMIDSYKPSKAGLGRVTVTIGGVSKEFVIQLGNEGVSAYSTTDCSAIIFSSRTSARTVDCSISVRSDGGGVAIKSPSMLILRGSGSFTQL